jgi:hypothetical protein
VGINIDVEMPAVETGDILNRMRRAAAEKRRDHGDSSRRAGRYFIPVVVHNLGGMGSDALDLLRRMADSEAAQSLTLGETWRQDQFVAFWVRRASIVTQQAAGDMALLAERMAAGGARARVSRLRATLTPHMVGGQGVSHLDVDTGRAAFRRMVRARDGTRCAGRHYVHS